MKFEDLLGHKWWTALLRPACQYTLVSSMTWSFPAGSASRAVHVALRSSSMRMLLNMHIEPPRLGTIFHYKLVSVKVNVTIPVRRESASERGSSEHYLLTLPLTWSWQQLLPGRAKAQLRQQQHLDEIAIGLAVARQHSWNVHMISVAITHTWPNSSILHPYCRTSTLTSRHSHKLPRGTFDRAGLVSRDRCRGEVRSER